MTDKQEETQMKKEVVQAKLLRDVIGVLQGNREALCHLPEMLQQLIEMPEALPKVEKGTNTLDEWRNEEDKATLARKEKEDLDEKVKFATEDSELKAERLSEKDKNLKKLSKTLQDKNDDLIRDITTKEGQLKDQAKRISSLEKKLQETGEKNVEIEKRFHQQKEVFKTTISGKEREIEQLKNRLASLSEKRVKQDQSKVEDMLSSNRQSKVEEDFGRFVDEARVDVLDRIRTLCHSKEKIYMEIYCPRLACLLFEAAYERMVEARKANVEFCKEIARCVVNSAPEQSRPFSLNEQGGCSSFTVSFIVNVRRQESNYPAEAIDALMLNFKESALTCNLDCFLNDVMQVAWSKWSAWQTEDRYFQLSPTTYILHDPTVVTYIKACMRVAWRMVTQIPPMQIEYNSSYLQNIHTKIGYHNSPDMLTKKTGPSGQDQEEEIACYLWPGLADGGGRLIRAGEVLCKIKGKR